MSWWKSFFVALNCYSKIPLPQIPWEEKDMKYALCFFPVVGVVIAGVLWLWYRIWTYLELGVIAWIGGGIGIPLLISGGIHLDGWLDTWDSLSSYQEKEKRLEILKDPHIGAFCIISLLAYGSIYVGALSENLSKTGVAIWCLGFVLSRILSGISVVLLPKAKKQGMVATFAKTAENKIVLAVLAVEGIIVMLVMVLLCAPLGIVIFLAQGIHFMYYKWKTLQCFGGTTGDTAGWFLCNSQGITLICCVCVLGVIERMSL